MKALSQLLLSFIALLSLAGCGGGGSNSNGNGGGAFNSGTFSLSIVAGTTSLAQDAATPVTVTVKNPDGTTASNGTAVSLSVTPVGFGTVGDAAGGAGSNTATSSTSGGAASFVFTSASQGGVAHLTASVQNTNATVSTVSTDITISSTPPVVITITPGATSIPTNSFTSLVVSVVQPDGSLPADGTAVNASLSPATIGTVSSAATGQVAGVTASSTLTGGKTTFLFNSTNQTGTANITISVPTLSVATSINITVTAGNASDPRLQLTASTTTLPLNPYGPDAENGADGFPSNYIGSPYIAEVAVQWRHSNGQLVSGTATVNVSITPVTIAGFSTLDDPTTTWSGETTTPPTVTGNEFLTIIGSGPVSVTGGIGTIFVHADAVPGIAYLTVTAIDPDNSQTISSQLAFTISGAASNKLPGAVTISQADGGVYISGANGPQSKLVSATVTDGNGALVADPSDGQGNSWNNVQFQITGPAGTDATITAVNAAGTQQTGQTLVTTTHNGIASVSFQAGTQQGPVQVKATVDRGDNNVDNQIQDPISATATVIVSDGKLYSLTLTSPGSKAPAILINRVSTQATLVNQSGSNGSVTIPPDSNATYSFTVSAIGTDRQGNPPIPGTTIKFGSIDTPQTNDFSVVCNGLANFGICGNQGDPKPGGTVFNAPDGHFVTAGGGAGPGDTLIVIGKQSEGAPAGNDDLESAVKVASVVGNTQLNVATAFNFNDTTGTSVDSGPVLPYVVGRSTIGNISSPATTDADGTASTTLNYPVSALDRTAAVWAQGTGIDTVNGSVNVVTDAAIMSFPGVAPATIVISPNPIPGNITLEVDVCFYDALGSPLPGVQFGFDFSNLGVGSGTVDGVSGAGVTANITGPNGCVATIVTTTGIVSGSGTTAPTLSFFVGNTTASAPITASGGLILLANPSEFTNGIGGTVTLTLENSNGTPVPGVQLVGSCTGDASIGTVVGGPTDANGKTTATISADLNIAGSPGSGSCTYTTSTGAPTAKVTLKGTDPCDGLSPLPPQCSSATPTPSTVALSIVDNVSGGTAASFSSSPSGVACSAGTAPSQSCNVTVSGDTYTLTPAIGSGTVTWSGSCTPSVGNTAKLVVPTAATTGLTCTMTVN